MIRYLIVGIIVTSGLIGAQLYLSQSTPLPGGTQPVTETPSNVPLRSLAVGEKAPIQGEESRTNSSRSNNESQGIDNTANSITNNSTEPPVQPWEVDDSLPETPTRYLNRGIDARPLKLDKTSFASVGVGDKVKFNVPQTGQDYEMAVREVGRHNNGDKRLKGHLINQPDYSVVMTEGRTATFATINTPDGAFLLEANGNQGWMLSMNDLDKMIDPNLVDYQIPDISR